MIQFKLKSMLEEHNISQRHLANISCVRPNTINDMCNGRTKRLELETLDAIMKSLNDILPCEVYIDDVIEYMEP